MSKVLVNNSSLADIAAAIREKNESDTKYKPAEMGAAIRDIESGGGNWYDFTVEATSDIANTTEFTNLLAPYLPNLEPMKDFALITMENSNVNYDSTAGVPLISYIFKRLDTKAFEGGVARYRGEKTLTTAIALSSGSAVKIEAGYKFYVKVVRILV